MSVDKSLLEHLLKLDSYSYQFSINLNENDYQISSVKFTNSPIPVNEPTTRGGVYFSDKFAYKMQCTVKDLKIIPYLTSKMLGPSTDFGNIVISGKISNSENSFGLELKTNLTNSVQTPDSIELHMIVVELKSV